MTKKRKSKIKGEALKIDFSTLFGDIRSNIFNLITDRNWIIRSGEESAEVTVKDKRGEKDNGFHGR